MLQVGILCCLLSPVGPLPGPVVTVSALQAAAAQPGLSTVGPQVDSAFQVHTGGSSSLCRAAL